MAFPRLLTAAFLLCCAATTALAEVKFKETGTIAFSTTWPTGFTQPLRDLMTEPANPNLAFSAKNLPTWLALHPTTGVLQGTNPPATPGVANFTITVCQTVQPEQCDAQHPFTMTIIVNPAWDANPLDLGKAKEDSVFTFDLKPHVSDPAGSTFTFAASGLPSWLSLNPVSGILSGTPRRVDVGSYTVVSITAITSHGSVSVPAKGAVEKTIKPPHWSANPIVLPKGNDATPYAQNTVSFAVNPEGTPLVFLRQSSPAWANVDDMGKITGQPTKADVGTSSVGIRLSTFIDGQEYHDDTIFQIPVEHIKQPPTWPSQTIDLGKAHEDSPFTFDLKTVVTDPEGGTIQFTATGLPAWLSMTPAGVLTGTPRRADVGLFSGITFTATASGGSSTASGKGEVLKTIHPPKWKSNPVILVDAREDESYDRDLLPFVDNFEGAALVFDKKGGTPWPAITTVGHITGIPHAADIGNVSVTAHFTTTIDGQSFEDTTTLTFKVVHVAKPPVWPSQTIDLGKAQEDSPFTFDLKTVVTDPEGGTILFTASGLPSWLTMTPAGVLTGTPRRKDVGLYSGIQFTATAVGGSSQAAGKGEVLKTIHPPKWKGNPLTLADAREDIAYLQDVSGLVDNPEGTALVFSKFGGPTWAGLNGTGLISGTPQKADIGPVTIDAKFTTTIDGVVFEDTTKLVFNVKQTKFPPQWSLNDVDLGTATEETPFTFDLKTVVTNPMGGAMVFTATGLPGWLSMNGAGILTGTPKRADVGPYSGITFTATAQGGSASAQGHGLVKKMIRPPKWIANPIALEDAHDDMAYQVPLAPFVLNPEGTPLTFTLIAAPIPPPAWLGIQTATGLLFGVPAKTDLGNVILLAKVSTTIEGQFYEDTTQLQFKVTHLVKPPSWVIEDIDLGTQDEDVPFTLDLKTKVNNPESGPLTFTATGLPGWLSLSGSGVLTGTPRRPNVGPYSGIKFTVTNTGGSATASGHGVVRKVLKFPKWTGNPIALPNGKQDVAYLQDLSRFVTNPEGAALTFGKAGGPPWAAVSSTGMLSGTPRQADVGDVQVQAQFSGTLDGQPFQETTTFTFKVLPGAQPPAWQFPDIDLGTQTVGAPFFFDLTDVAVDPQGEVLSFSATGLPSWMSLTNAGALSGTPRPADIGPYAGIVFTAVGPGGPATAKGHGVVKAQSLKPKWIAPEIDIDDATESLPYAKGLSDYVLNPGNVALTYSFLPAPLPPTWTQLQQTTGVLFGTPQATDVGPVRISVKFIGIVDGQVVEDTTLLRFNVKGLPKPPTWLENPIRFTAYVDKPFDATIRNKAKDPANRPLTFTMSGGNPWLALASTGDLTGTPRTANLGDNTYDVRVCNDLAPPRCANAVLIVTVKQGTTDQTDTVVVDAPVPARVENLWVVGSSIASSCLTKVLNENIHVYFDALRSGGITSAAVFLSGSGKKDGEPMRLDDSHWLLLGGPSIATETSAADFQARHKLAYIPGLFTKKLNSPIWSMHRFYERVPSMSSIYHNGYMEPTIPMEGMIATVLRDHHKCFSQGTPQESWGASEYAQSFVQFHRNERKPYRVSAMTPDCLALVASRCAETVEEREALEAYCQPARESEDSDEARCGDGDAYTTVVNATGGKRYKIESSGNGITDALRDYAKEVIFRAYVNAKRKIHLSKIPATPLQMTVSLADVVLAGNTGGANDRWRYLAATNEVEIFWERITEVVVAPGDRLKIIYKAAGLTARR